MFLADAFARFDALAAGNLERLLVTGIVVVAVLVVRTAAKRWREREDLGTRGRLVLSTTVAAATALGAVAVLGVWGLGGYLVQSLERLELADHVTNIVLTVVLLGSAYVVSDFFGQVIRELLREQNAVDKHQEEVTRRTVQLSVYALALLLVVGLFTDNVGSLLVGAGFLGIVIGMAARQTLGAVLAGFVLMFSRPFEVGDWVVIGEHEGIVSEITIINTRLRSFDGEFVTIPNDEVRSEAVVDRSWQDRLRIEVEVGIDYAADADHAAETALAAVEGIEEVMTVPEPAVVAKRFGDSAVVLGVRFWIDNPTARKRWRAQTHVISAVKDAFEAEGIDIPYPQREHTAREEAGGFQVALGDGASGDRVLSERDGDGASGDGASTNATDAADSGEPFDASGGGGGPS